MKRRHSGKSNGLARPSKPPAREINPMLMFEVLSHFFTVISFNVKDFKNFRLVCREWFKSSLGRWREEVWLSLQDTAAEESITNEQSCLHLDDFLKLINTPGDPHQFFSDTNHFRKFKVSFSKDLCFGTPGRLEFWTKIGPKMTHLDISNSTISSTKDLSRILFEMTRNLTCLKFQSRHSNELEIPVPNRGLDDILMEKSLFWCEIFRPGETSVQRKLVDVHLNLCISRNFNFSWVYFFARLPNIKKLKIDSLCDVGWSETDLTEQYIFFRSFQMVREKMGLEYFSQLEELDLLNMVTRAVDKLSPFLLLTLRDLNFPLRSLQLDIGYSDNWHELNQLLEIYSNTLEKLVVYRAPHCAPFSIDVPYEVNMPHLTELRFIGPIMKDLSFLRNVQNLKKLELSSNCVKTNPNLEVRPGVDVVRNTKFLSSAFKNFVLDQLETFFVESEMMICSAERVKALGKLFPNLKTLRIGLKDDGFAMVCKTWEKIETLNVEPNELTEKGILGKAEGQNYRKPNITDLKELKTLRMGSPLKNSTKGRLTTDSILHGLLVCPNLKEVSMAVAPQASQSAQERLASKCLVHSAPLINVGR